MKNYKFADVRYNGGSGVLLCSVCRVILAYGYEHEDAEHVCRSCVDKKPDLLKTMKLHEGLRNQF